MVKGTNIIRNQNANNKSKVRVSDPHAFRGAVVLCVFVFNIRPVRGYLLRVAIARTGIASASRYFIVHRVPSRTRPRTSANAINTKEHHKKKTKRKHEVIHSRYFFCKSKHRPRSWFVLLYTSSVTRWSVFSSAQINPWALISRPMMQSSISIADSLTGCLQLLFLLANTFTSTYMHVVICTYS